MRSVWSATDLATTDSTGTPPVQRSYGGNAGVTDPSDAAFALE